MNFVGDFHIHTLASGDAFGTITEIIEVAKKRNLRCIAITEHGPKMEASAHPYYFESLIDNIKGDDGIIIYPGVEANILDEYGTLDLPDTTLQKLEFIKASFHTFSWKDKGKQGNTKALISCLNRYDIKSIAHLNYPFYPIDIQQIIPILLEKRITIEINNKALNKHKKNWDIFRGTILQLKKKGVKFLVCSDAHYPSQVGKFNTALEFIRFCGLQEEDILNTDFDKLINYLRLRSEI